MAGLLWPREQLFLTDEALARLQRQCRDSFVKTCRRLEIAQDLTPLLDALYLPLAAWLDTRRKQQQQSLVVGLCGAQGSGKSTVGALLKLVLEEGFAQRVVAFSLDDFYKTRADRQKMAREVHPLFTTRGVPGTHDVDLGIALIAALRALGPGHVTAIPAFDKATDDRCSRETWPIASGPVDTIIFEGWCVGARPQPEASLRNPVNELESSEDQAGTWRAAVNQALAGEYQKLFSLIDVLLLLKVDRLERVFAWRRLQERKLARRAVDAGTPERDLHVMSPAQVNRFVMHYERLTRHILAEMPQRADIVFSLDETHNPATVQINKPVVRPPS
jgi:D-glycerate 3-kinase